MLENIDWTRVLIYVLILIVIYIFVKLTNLKFFGKPVLSLKWRIIIALFFPVILILGIVFGALIFGVVIVVFLIMWISSLFGRKKKIVLRF